MTLTLTRRQKLFCDSTAFETLYGGAAGGGKSYGQIADALLFALRCPGSRQIIFRRTLPELEKSLVRYALALYPREAFCYTRADHTGRFVNGSVIDFAYCDAENDVYRYQSAEYDVIRFDELTHFTESMYLYLISRCRGTNGYPKAIKSTSNPGGVGHSWVKKRFVDLLTPDRPAAIDGMTRVFIPARVTDNRFLMDSDPQYVDRLKALDERDRRALLDGDWDLAEGRFFSDFDKSLHVVEPFPLPDGTRYYVSLDYGLDMLAAYKLAVTPDGSAYAVAEVYEGKDNGGNGLIVSKAAKRIRALCADDGIRAVFAPPDLWSRQKDSGSSIASLFFQCGVSLTRVSASRVAGWMALKEWLKPESGPRLRIFACCKNLIRAMSLLQCDAYEPADCAGTPHELTHAPDALRYFVSGSPRPPAVSPPAYRYGFSFERQKTAAELEKSLHII